jgi:predicted AlkP superfamily phosphohydrolase/phosphomutase
MPVYTIGLDGLPYSMLKSLMERGCMPFLSSLVKGSNISFLQSRSSIPPVSSVAWTTWMTGSNPAEHGILGFADFVKGSYKVYFPMSKDRKREAVFEAASKKGSRCAVINLPSTFPATPLNGRMVSGFVALDLERSVYPKDWITDLKKIDYRIDLDLNKARDLGYLCKELDELLSIRQRAFQMTLKEGFDLWIGIITETDRLLHFLYHAYEGEGNQYHPFVLEYFRKIDKVIEGLFTDYIRDSPFFILSDHGFTRIKTEFYLNNWLIEEGYLMLLKDLPAIPSDIYPAGSLFISLDPGRIYCNRRERFKEGLEYTEEEWQDLIDELLGKLFSLEFEGERVVDRILFKEEAYHGEYIDNAPDLVLLSRDGFDLKSRMQNKEVFAKTHFTGCHTYNDAFLITNAEAPLEPDVENIGRALFKSMGLD